MAPRGDIVKVLVADPELGLRIPASAVTEAREQLVAPVVGLERGTCEMPGTEGAGRHLGFLLLDGLLAREIVMAGSLSTELLGEGDLIQPWVAASEDRLIRFHVSWRVLEPTRLAVLDERFAHAAARWPSVSSALLERAVRRTVRQAVHQALLQLSPVETRLLVLFWLLAERWGRVTPRGILLPLRLPHKLLGQLVGARRASVTTALKHVDEAGLIGRRADGGWLLWGSPPDAFVQMQWPREESSPMVSLPATFATPSASHDRRRIAGSTRA